MADLLHDLVRASASGRSEDTALVFRDRRASYGELLAEIQVFAAGLMSNGIGKQDRVAIYLPKQIETVVAIFGTSAAGGIFVPINPVLKASQVSHILNDSGASILVTSRDRLRSMQDVIGKCSNLKFILVTDGGASDSADNMTEVRWSDFMTAQQNTVHRVIDSDIASILYTSGSTGKPKGVVLSHRNLVVGAVSVSSYLGNNRDDRILAVLPLSFDAGFSQVSTAFNVGATAVLHDYFFAADIVKIVQKENITGLTAVPPLWAQIADPEWPEEASSKLRYFANTGGKMPGKLLARLRQVFSRADPFLMYGLTEAFRSTYLPPSEVDRRPDSIGKAIPNAEILVIRDDGSECGPDEPGELVHRGSLVAQGYWNDASRTKERFRPNPLQSPSVPRQETVVYSGDTVRKDEDGFLYFVGRKDDMIKTSGYRVSPTEVEEVGFDSGLVKEIVALGIEDEVLGQRIVVVAVPSSENGRETDALLGKYRDSLPTFMVPADVVWREQLPRSANGKIDRQELLEETKKTMAKQ